MKDVKIAFMYSKFFLLKDHKKLTSFLYSALWILNLLFFSSSLQAETCPVQAQIRLQPDGYFVTANGWRSQSKGYRGTEGAQLVFRLVSFTKEANGKTHFEGCRYEIGNESIILPMTMSPPLITPVTAVGRNWEEVIKTPSLTTYECVANLLNDPCEFTIGATRDNKEKNGDNIKDTTNLPNSAVNPFGRVF